ncbi:AfsR/SARP family transcriptional regulator [Actinospica robiniae]|uniref:DNA-binding transcriptional activator of the SARP family n=1 Tax=Actinospica robiniae DSM 44927 TaxID=479430 RepID=W9E4Z9_9ACTN|nr:BTAD domain-containing putative transcriptional regulator [Actinospica robiniae]ETA71071.1 DNA-binding transcriptional activator of the SARP family [Actinospica robiniae DSM 44927]
MSVYAPAPADEAVQISVLGPLEVFDRGGERLLLRGPQTRTVFALLLLGAGTLVPTERLIEGVWGECPPPSAVLKVQGHICTLRKLLRPVRAAELLVTRPPGYRLQTEYYRCDLDEFTAAVRHAAALSAADDIEQACEVLDRALGCWRGPAFADISSEHVQRHVVRIHGLRSIAVQDRAWFELRLGRALRAIEQLGPEVDAYPLDERAREILIRAYLRLGQRHAALACYESGRSRLRDELGVSPGPALQRLAAVIRHGAASGLDPEGATP